MKTAAIISTGNELLYGATVDTNSGYISGRLYPLAVRVVMHLAVGDDTGELERGLRGAIDGSDIVLVTGGLGPTDDDNTIEALRRIFGFSLREDRPARERMDRFFAAIGMRASDRDLKMVEVPSTARVLPNSTGLAPGFILEERNKIVIAMPGVPSEMTRMMNDGVIPFLKDECGIGARGSLSIRVIGMKESDINAAIRSMNIGGDAVIWGMTAKEGITTVTFVAAGDAPVAFDAILSDSLREFGGRMLDPEFDRPEEEASHLLRGMGLTVGTAESCTGGLIATRLTDLPGASDVFAGGIVAYDNRVKAGELDVPEDIIMKFGAVSEEVAGRMAAGARSRIGTDIGLSATGIAGPGGGTAEKPVGTVCFGLSDGRGTDTATRNFPGSRERIRSMASLAAIEYLRQYLKEMKKKNRP